MKQPDDLPNKNHVLSNELKEGCLPHRNPRDNFPEHTRGKIMEWRSKSENELKRRQAHQSKMQKNSNHYIHGKYSYYRPMPKYVLDRFETIDELDLNDIQTLRETVEQLIKDNLIRIQAGLIFEMYDGGVQDKSLSRLIKETVYLIFLYNQFFNLG